MALVVSARAAPDLLLPKSNSSFRLFEGCSKRHFERHQTLKISDIMSPFAHYPAAFRRSRLLAL